MCKRLYPISKSFFDKKINPLIISHYSRAGRPQKISNYQVFSAILYVLRTGIPWRDLPKGYGNWHSIYLRFKKGSDRGVWWNIILTLQQDNDIKMRVVMADSTTIKFHRHGGGLKGGFKVGGEA
jgi:transposase